MKSSVQCMAYEHDKVRSIVTSVSEDILRFLKKSPESQAAGNTVKSRLSAFLRPELLSLLLYRIAHYLYVTGWRRMAILLTRINFLVHKANITPESCIGPGCRMSHPAGLTFCGTAGRGVTVFALSTCCPDGPFSEECAEMGPVLGDNVLIGGHTVVIGPVHIGQDAKISFGVRLNRDVPPGVVVISRTSRGQSRRNTTPAPTV